MNTELDALVLEAALRAPRTLVAKCTGISTHLDAAFLQACRTLGIVTVDDLRARLPLLEAWIGKQTIQRATVIPLALKAWLMLVATRPAETQAAPKPSAWHARNKPEPHRGVPSMRDEVEVWARENGVDDLLDLTFGSFRHLMFFHQSPGVPSPTLREVFTPTGPAFKGTVCSIAELTRWRREVQETLLDTANKRLAQRTARAAFLERARETLPLPLRDLDETLAAIQRLLPAVPAMYEPYPAGEVRFVPTSAPKLEIVFGRGFRESVHVPLAHLADLPREGVAPVIAADPRAAAVVTHVRDMLRDPDSATAKRLGEHLAVPAWQRTLARFEELSSQRTATSTGRGEDRLLFKISHRYRGFPTVQVLVQTAKKSRAGDVFTAGRVATASRARTAASTSLERQICDALIELETGAGYYTASTRARLQVALITLLADHPRVFLIDGHERPARVRAAPLEVHLVPGPMGNTLSFGVAGLPVAARAVLDGAIDHETSVVTHAETDTIALVRFGSIGTDLLTALAEHPAAFPVEATEQLLAVLERLQESVEVVVSPELEGEVVAADTRPHVRIAPLGAEDEGLLVRFAVRPLPAGPLLSPGEGGARVFGQGERGRVCAHRDFAAERSACEAVREAVLPAKRQGLVLEGEWTVHVGDGDAAAEMLVAIAERSDVIVEHAADKPPTIVRVSTKEVRLRVRKDRDWFGLAGEIAIDETRLELAALLSAARNGRRFVRVGKDKIVALADDLRARLRALDDAVTIDRQGHIVADAFAVPAVDALADAPEALTATKEWLALRERRRAAETFEPTLPKGLKASLRSYQQEGFAWLARLAAWCEGACLADDMGLGKTVQTLALLLHRKATGPALVLAPTSVVANWLAEAARFAPSLRLRLYRGAGRAKLLEGLRAGDVVVCSYDVMVRDIVALERVTFGTLVLDEAQAIKNAQSRRAGAVRDLRAGFRLALSGTPIENHLGELWSLFHAIAPGLFGSWDRFRERFAQPIERDKDPERSRALATRVRPFLLRRTKEAVAPELPALTETVRTVTLSPGERERYETERLASIDLIRKADPITGRFAMLAAITRLRRLACNVRLVDEEARLPSSKLGAFLDTVDQIREASHRALVFSQFTTHLALVREALDARGIRYQYLDGQTPAEARQARVEAFQRGEGDLFLLSLKAGGTGLNLTGADYVLHLDPWWNPAVEDQATDRAHRIGQTKPVTVVRFVSAGTIEEGVIALHAEKRELADSLLEGGEMAAKLSSKQLLALVRAGEVEAVEAEGEGEALGRDGQAQAYERLLDRIASSGHIARNGRKPRADHAPVFASAASV